MAKPVKNALAPVCVAEHLDLVGRDNVKRKDRHARHRAVGVVREAAEHALIKIYVVAVGAWQVGIEADRAAVHGKSEIIAVVIHPHAREIRARAAHRPKHILVIQPRRVGLQRIADERGLLIIDKIAHGDGVVIHARESEQVDLLTAGVAAAQHAVRQHVQLTGGQGYIRLPHDEYAVAACGGDILPVVIRPHALKIIYRREVGVKDIVRAGGCLLRWGGLPARGKREHRQQQYENAHSLLYVHTVLPNKVKNCTKLTP